MNIKDDDPALPFCLFSQKDNNGVGRSTKGVLLVRRRMEKGAELPLS